MPVENERKYLLSLMPDYIERLVEDYDGRLRTINQAYVDGARIRSIDCPWGGRTEYKFTWKSRRPDGSRLEIERVLSKKDFDDLWSRSKNMITKQRVSISIENILWDVDFLYKSDIKKDHYLTIAEAEMPEGWDEPNNLPNFVRQNLLYLVPRYKDDLWTNAHLTNPAQVSKMLVDALAER